MKIAFDAKRLFNNFTGLGNYSRTLVKNLHTYYPDIEIHLCTPKITHNDETAYFIESNQLYIHAPKLNYPGWREFGLAGLVNEISPDIYHGLSHELPFGLNSTIKKVVTFHDLIYAIYPKQFHWWDRNMYALKYRSAAMRADKIIAISKSTAHDLQNIYGIHDDVLTVVYQSCNADFQNQVVSENHDSHFFLYVGSLIERKGLINIVFAYSKLPSEKQLPFVVIGNGPKEYKDKVQEMITYYRLNDKFKFVNTISNADLLNYYRSAHCLVYPSIYEGFGIPLIESLFSGTPAITTDISSLPEAAGPGALYIRANNIDDLAQALLEIQDPTLHNRLSEDGFQYVHHNFTAKATTDILVDTYKDILLRRD